MIEIFPGMSMGLRLLLDSYLFFIALVKVKVIQMQYKIKPYHYLNSIPQLIKINNYKQQMFSVVVIITQLLAVIFIGAFGRSTTADSNSSSYFLTDMTFLLGFTLMYIPYKKLTLHSLVVLIITSAITFETYVLFSTFWDSCFNGFSTQFSIDIKLLVRSVFCQLAVLMICLDYIGIFGYWQIYLFIAPIITIGYTLNSAILISGLKIFDGGAGMQAFFFSGVASLFIWALAVRGKATISLHKKAEHYTGYTICLIGIMISFITWPQLNVSGALISVSNSILTSSATLEASAFPNTLFALSVGLLIGMLFLTNDSTQSSKMKLKTYVDCFVNAGIVCASYSDIELNPAAGMTIALFSTIMTLIFYKYIYSSEKKGEKEDITSVRLIIQHYRPVIFRILMPLLGVIVCSIVIATRQTRTPSLLNATYSSIAGLQLAGFFITLAIAIVFGAICGLVINCFVSYKVQNSESEVNYLTRSTLTDLDFFDDLNQQIFPLYLSKEDQYMQEDETARRIIRQSLLSHLKDNSETKKVQKVEQRNMIITNQFTKSNIKNPYTSVSKMKDNLDDEIVSEEVNTKPLQTNQKEVAVRKSYIVENQEIVRQIIARKIQFSQKQSDIENENVKK